MHRLLIFFSVLGMTFTASAGSNHRSDKIEDYNKSAVSQALSARQGQFSAVASTQLRQEMSIPSSRFLEVAKIQVLDQTGNNDVFPNQKECFTEGVEGYEEAIDQAITDSAEFLAQFHGRSLGRKFSKLFHINRVAICDLGNHKQGLARPGQLKTPGSVQRVKVPTLVFSQQTLYVLIGKKNKVPENYIMKGWKSGVPVLKSPITQGLLKKLIPPNKWFDRTKRKAATVKFKSLWKLIINPIGTGRSEAHSLLYRWVHKRKSEAMADPRNFIKGSTFVGGFTPEQKDHLNDVSQDSDRSRSMVENMFSLEQSGSTLPDLLRALMSAKMPSQDAAHISVQKQRGLVAVSNSHKINVALGITNNELDGFKATNNQCENKATVRWYENGEIQSTEATGNATITISDQKGLFTGSFNDFIDVSLPSLDLLKHYMVKKQLN